jgi:hypothetical protein
LSTCNQEQFSMASDEKKWATSTRFVPAKVTKLIRTRKKWFVL